MKKKELMWLLFLRRKFYNFFLQCTLLFISKVNSLKGVYDYLTFDRILLKEYTHISVYPFFFVKSVLILQMQDFYPTASLCILTLQEPLTNGRLTPKRALFKHHATQTLLIHSCGAERALNLSEAVFLLPDSLQVGHL